MLGLIFSIRIHHQNGMTGKIFGHVGNAKCYGLLMPYISGQIYDKILTIKPKQRNWRVFIAPIVYPTKCEFGKKIKRSFFPNGLYQKVTRLPVVKHRNDYKNLIISIR